jgi:signal transduction histidine kinase
MAFIAKFSSTCPQCSFKIEKGTLVMYNDSKKVVHQSCPTSTYDTSVTTTAPSKVKSMVKSPYQQAVYDEFVNTNHNLVIEAVAGSGKTTMLEMLVDAIPAWASKNNLSYENLQKELSQRDEFISLASHEIKNPLTTLKVYSHLLNDKTLDSPKKYLIAEKIASSTNRIEKLVDERIARFNVTHPRVHFLNLSV